MAIVNYSSTITTTTTSSPTLTFNSSGSGSLTLNKEVLKWYTYENDILPEYVTFDNTSAKTITYTSVGASPVGGSLNLTTVGDLVKPAPFITANTNALGSIASNNVDLSEIRGYAGSNTIKNNTFAVRTSAGNDWTTAVLHNSIGIDNLYVTPGTDTKCFWERNPYNETHTFGSSGKTFLTLSSTGISAVGGTISNTNTIALAGTASGTNSTTIGYNSTGTASTASAAGSMALGGSTASGAGAVAIGNSYATNTGSIAIGSSYSSGTTSFAVSIANTTSSYGATGYTSVAIGNQAIASNSGAYAFGGYTTASGQHSRAMGLFCTASADYSYASGLWAVSSQIGKHTYGAGFFGAAGDRQAGKIIVVAATTTTTAVVLTSDANAAATNNQLIVASGQAMTFWGTLIAKQSASANMASYTFKGAIVNNGGTITISTISVETMLDTIVLDVQPTFTADSTNKALAVTSGYKAATSIRWVCNIDSVEVTHA